MTALYINPTLRISGDQPSSPVTLSPVYSPPWTLHKSCSFPIILPSQWTLCVPRLWCNDHCNRIMNLFIIYRMRNESTYTHIHTNTQDNFRISNYAKTACLWTAGGNPRRHGDSLRNLDLWWCDEILNMNQSINKMWLMSSGAIIHVFLLFMILIDSLLYARRERSERLFIYLFMSIGNLSLAQLSWQIEDSFFIIIYLFISSLRPDMLLLWSLIDNREE